MKSYMASKKKKFPGWPDHWNNYKTLPGSTGEFTLRHFWGWIPRNSAWTCL